MEKQEIEQFKGKKKKLIFLWCGSHVILSIFFTWNKLMRMSAPGSEVLSEGLELLVICVICVFLSIPILKKIHWYSTQTEAKWSARICKLLMIHHAFFVLCAAVYFLTNLIK